MCVCVRVCVCVCVWVWVWVCVCVFTTPTTLLIGRQASSLVDMVSTARGDSRFGRPLLPPRVFSQTWPLRATKRKTVNVSHVHASQVVVSNVMPWNIQER